jgi:uncharacterized lipoprotein YddW (UPF0748 family)
MEEIRGVWIANHPHSQVLTSQDNINDAIAFLAATGFNTIFPVVWNRGYTLFPSQVMKNYGFPDCDPFYQQQQRDPLREIIAAAHKNNIKVIPWLEYGFAASHLLSGGHILQQKPHWKAIDKLGETVRHGSLTWMNALNSEVQQFMLKLVLEIIEQYDVDGIQGCDRFPALPIAAGYDRETIATYQTEFDKPPPSNPKQKQWIQWRADILTKFLKHLYQQVKAVNPQLIVSLSPAVYPFSLDNLLQDSKAWIEQGLVDIIHPQIYRSSFFSYRAEVKKIIQLFPPDSLTKFVPGIALTANGKDITPKDLIKYIQLNRQHNFRGQILFHYEGLRRDHDAVAIALCNFCDYNRVATLPSNLT